MTVMPGVPVPVTALTEEVRLATTLTGGVSLAVWMGGVARELDLLSQAATMRRLAANEPTKLPDDHPSRFYLDLINLLDVTVDVDVLSGTSAGGINAALLAYGRACQRDLGSLRDLWLEIGAFDTLLRDPTDSKVPSLLQGDAQMYAQLCRALPRLPQVAHPAPQRLSTTLFVTTTLLTGEPSRFTDTFGTLVQDVNHRGIFRFTQDTLDRTAALALAARSSASFPGAFEPSFLPFQDPVPATKHVPARPAVGELANISRNHWVADGGLLDNQPLDALLDTVFHRPARRLVRRVLLYVVPSTGPVPDPATTPPADQVSQPYSMLGSLLKDVGAVFTQSIAADLRAIREHNQRLEVGSDVRLRLAQMSSAENDLGLLSEDLFTDFRARAAEQVADQLVPELLRLISVWPEAQQPPAGGRPTVPPRWTAALLPGGTVERDCRRAIAVVLTERWPARPTNADELARFGRSTFHGVRSIVLSLLRSACVLLQLDDADPAQVTRLTEQLTALHAAFRPDEQRDAAQFVRDEATDPQLQALELPAAAAELARRYLDALDRPAAMPPGCRPPGGPSVAWSAGWSPTARRYCRPARRRPTPERLDSPRPPASCAATPTTCARPAATTGGRCGCSRSTPRTARCRRPTRSRSNRCS